MPYVEDPERRRLLRELVEMQKEIARGVRTYFVAPDGQSITCLRCLRTSYHPEDIAQCYCGSCKIFHKEQQVVWKFSR